MLSWWGRPIPWMPQGWRRTAQRAGLTRMLKRCLRDTATRQRRLRSCSNLITGGGPHVPGSGPSCLSFGLPAEPKLKGSLLYCGKLDDELPALHWLLRERAAEVFQGLVESHRNELREFVAWLLDKARTYTKYFAGRYNYTSSTVYTCWRPRFAAWAGLGKEVQDAATSLGIPFPNSLRFPAMPDLE